MPETVETSTAPAPEPEYANEFLFTVQGHDMCAADKARAILDRPFIVTIDGIRRYGFSMLVEVYRNGQKFNEERWRGLVQGKTDPLEEVRNIALGLFRSTKDQPLTYIPEPEPEAEPEDTTAEATEPASTPAS